jgi:hypothetical protein
MNDHRTSFHFDDGTPFQPVSSTPRQGPVANPEVNRRLSVEGLRSVSTRTAVWLRHVVYALTLLLCAAVTSWSGLFSGAGAAVLVGSAALLLVAGVLGTWLLPASRKEIIEQARHYAFGIVALPGAGIAVIYRLSLTWARSGSSSNSWLLDLSQNALPLVFFATVLLPIPVFIKVLSGWRFLNRSRMDDQEAIALWTRQDGLQR